MDTIRSIANEEALYAIHHNVEDKSDVEAKAKAMIRESLRARKRLQRFWNQLYSINEMLLAARTIYDSLLN